MPPSGAGARPIARRSDRAPPTRQPPAPPHATVWEEIMSHRLARLAECTPVFAFAIASFALMLAGTGPAMAAEVSFFPLPSGAYPHDVAPAPDGTVWYSDQPHGQLGRFDPRSGKVVD